MAKCPACQKNIDDLDYHVTVSEGGCYYPDGSYDEKDSQYEGYAYFCPLCHAELDISFSEEANKFLSGELPVLTKAQQEAYLKEPTSCPVCRKGVCNGGSMDFEAGAIIQKMDCPDCGAAWHDVYTLTGVHARS